MDNGGANDDKRSSLHTDSSFNREDGRIAADKIEDDKSKDEDESSSSMNSDENSDDY
jgi:hypothetical protein